MGIREAHAFCAKLIEVRSWDLTSRVSDVTVAHVIGEDEDEVGLGEKSGRMQQRAGGEEKE